MMTDRDILRGLAGRIAELAQRPVQAERVALWERSNGLLPNRPMVTMAEGEMPWAELAAADDVLVCRCADPELRRLEGGFRRKLWMAEHLDTDHVVEGTLWVEQAIVDTGFGLEKQEVTIEQAGGAVAAHRYEPVIRDLEDVEKIRFPEISHDEAATRAKVQRLEALVGDLLPVRVCGRRTHTFNAWDTIVQWTGITEALMDLVMRPDYCHAIVRRLTDAVHARMDRMEGQGLLDAPNPKATVGSGAAGYTRDLPQPDCDGKRFRYRDLWGSATSQIFGEVSPEMHAEFAITYENETLARCGLAYYGCCEPLHNKMAQLDAIANLRKVSISPWCDTKLANDHATRKYVFSHKPNPNKFAVDSYDGAAAERELRERLDASSGHNVEIIAKDISTARGDPRRLIDWTRMAMRVAREYEA